MKRSSTSGKVPLRIEVVEPAHPMHKYPTRSKNKRLMDRVDSDSETFEPHSKKHCKVTTTNSVTSKSSESEPNQIEKSESSGEISSSEEALNIDLILISLFSYVDYPTLKICRLVSKKWRNLGATELKRRPGAGTIKLSFGHFVDQSEKSARTLIAVMSNTEAEGNIFPCNSFEISTKNLSSPRIQIFFNFIANQNRIKKLSLTLDYLKTRMLLTETSLMADLWNLLFLQLPNLNFLEIKFFLPSHWVFELDQWNQNRNNANNPLNISNTNTNIITGINKSGFLPQLTTFELTGSFVPLKLFEDLMDASVNLKSFIARDSYHTLLDQLNYFVDGNGKNRIHLLKRIDILVYDENYIGLMERLVGENGGNLKLESIYIHQNWDRNQGQTHIFWGRVGLLINRILELSADSLVNLVMCPMRFLPGLVIPPLPKVDHLVLVGTYLNDIHAPADTNYFFPQEFSFNRSFPNVTRVGFWGPIFKFIQMMDISESIPSVELFVFKNTPVTYSLVVRTFLALSIIAMFPNATFRRK